MPKNFNSIHVKKAQGHLIVFGMGQTPKGQKYIKGQAEIEAESPSDPKFKEELAAAVVKLVG